MRGISVIVLGLAQLVSALDLPANNELRNVKEASPIKTRDNGMSHKFNGVWWPLPEGFDQSQPDKILDLVEEKSSTLPFGNTLAFSGVVVFGDSSSDTKNEYNATNHLSPSQSEFWNGRISNGPMWPDYLQKHYNVTVDNYAYNGATVNSNVFSHGQGIPDFSDQIDNYTKHPVSDPERVLVIVSFIGNDLSGGQGAEKLAYDIYTNLQRLYDNGFRNFAVFEGANPTYLFELGMKQAMVALVTGFQAQHPQSHIELFPSFDLVRTYARNAPPTATGVWNANGKLSCFDPNVEKPCSDPQNYILYDKFHPSTIIGYNWAIDLAQFINEKWNL